MALITISGYPCSGKSTRAEQLRQHLEERLQDPSYAGPQLKVVVLSDDTLNLSRDVYNGAPHPSHLSLRAVILTGYTYIAVDVVVPLGTADGRAEKPARAALFTAAQRQMGPDTLLVVDSMNYIKGFRYQLYCAAREHKLRVCTVSLLVLVLVSFSFSGGGGADARARTCAYTQVFVAAPPDRCKAWNDARLAAGEPAYASET